MYSSVILHHYHFILHKNHYSLHKLKDLELAAILVICYDDVIDNQCTISYPIIMFLTLTLRNTKADSILSSDRGLELNFQKSV